MERRLILANVQTINDLYKLSPKNMRTIWSSVQGERFWNMLRGNDIEEITTKTSTIGHSHVLHPNWRNPDLAKHILNRLVLKAASRLRRKSYFCKKIKILQGNAKDMLVQKRTLTRYGNKKLPLYIALILSTFVTSVNGYDCKSRFRFYSLCDVFTTKHTVNPVSFLKMS